jgi:hypothetical protein
MVSDQADEEMRDAGATETPGESEFPEDLEDALDRIRMVTIPIRCLKLKA